MAYNEDLATRLRLLLAPLSSQIEEKKMFGGLAFMYLNKMSVGVMKDRLTVRVIASKEKELLSRKGIAPMTFTGKAMKEFVFVDPDVFSSDDQLNELIDLGLEHARQAQKGKKK